MSDDDRGGIRSVHNIVEEARGDIERFRELFIERFCFSPVITDRDKRDGDRYIRIN
jgi:hypothetical protein